MNIINQTKEDVTAAKILYNKYLIEKQDLLEYLTNNPKKYDFISDQFYSPKTEHSIQTVLNIIDIYANINRSWDEYYCRYNLFFMNEGNGVPNGIIRDKIKSMLNISYEVYLLINRYGYCINDIKGE